MIVDRYASQLYFKIHINDFVMSAFEKTGTPTFTRVRKNNKVLATPPSNRLFRVVVNNFKQQEEEFLNNNEEIVETMMDDHQGLPPQPTGYLKFPTYDPF